jgi:RNA polymerase sigma factor (TIGR02999 family)
MTQPPDVTGLLARWTEGDEVALEELFPVVYRELRALAAGRFRSERPGHTLQPTALVHEAYLRLVRQEPGRVANRTHFFALAAKAMRQVLIDHARRRNAEKRLAERNRITFVEGLLATEADRLDLEALDDALRALAEFRPRAARIVELRFFGGLTLDEAAEILDLSPATVGRDWTAAKLWLQAELSAK